MKNWITTIITLFTISILCCHCELPLPQRTVFSSPPTIRTYDRWDDIFLQVPQIDSFKVLHTGSVRVPTNGMLNPKRIKDHNPFGKFMWVDVYAFLFHHKKRGWFMIDSGLDSTFQGKGNIRGLIARNYIKLSRQEKGQNIAAQLKREQKQLQGIYFTHLHGDHTAGLPEIDKCIPKFAAKGEQYLHYPLLYQSNHLSKQDTLFDLDWEKGQSISPITSALDIFGDQSFWGIYTPGHSNSHMSYLLITETSPILLTGDASHTKYGFEKGIEPGWVSDREKAIASLKQLRSLKAAYPDLHVIYGHEQ